MLKLHHSVRTYETAPVLGEGDGPGSVWSSMSTTCDIEDDEVFSTTTWWDRDSLKYNVNYLWCPKNNNNNKRCNHLIQQAKCLNYSSNSP